MRKIWNFIISIPKDKLLHGIAGLFANAFAFAVAFRFLGLWLSLAVAIAVAFFILLLKEVYDLLNPVGHSFEMLDIASGIIGALLIDIPFLIALL